MEISHLEKSKICEEIDVETFRLINISGVLAEMYSSSFPGFGLCGSFLRRGFDTFFWFFTEWLQNLWNG